MARVKVNFGDVQDFDALPEGVYEAVIEKIEYREAKEKGKFPYLNVEYTVVEPEEYAGRKVWEILSWSPKALFRMRDFFQAAGYEDEEYDLDVDEESNLLVEPDLTGEAVTLTIENEIYEKKERNRVVATEFANPLVADDEDDEEEEEDEEPTPITKAKSAKKKAAPVEEEEDEDDEDDEAEDDEDEDEDDEEEEEEPPARKPVKKAAAPARAATKKKAPAKRTFR